VAVVADGRWFVGPDNGLISVTAARAAKVEVHAIGWRPQSLSASFHGRDLFAPVAAMLAGGKRKSARLEKRTRLSVNLGPRDISEVIYADHYGNLMTGMRAAAVPPHRNLTLRGRRVAHARVFAAAAPGQLFWYQNSLGLVEVAANGASAQQLLRASLGDRVRLIPTKPAVARAGSAPGLTLCRADPSRYQMIRPTTGRSSTRTIQRTL
jgi:S-adenosylmethionine hydrolase